MTIESSLRAAICRMANVDKMSTNAIAEQLSIHHSTVKRALKIQSQKLNCERQFPPSLLKHEGLIKEIIEKYPKVQGKSLRRLLKDLSVDSSSTTCIRALRFLRGSQQSIYGIRTTLPGVEAQYDWGEKTILIGSKKRKIYIFVMVLSHSRNVYAAITENMKTETLAYFHTEAFKWFGGVPRKILYDNMKTVVIERAGDVIQFSKSFFDYSAHYLFEPIACHVRTPQEKGRVERQVGSIKNNFFNAREFCDLEDLNNQLGDWLIERLSNSHPTDKSKTINDIFKTEEPFLIRLPKQHLVLRRAVIVSIGKQAFAQFETNRYSIPPEHAHSTVRLLVGYKDIEIYRGNSLIATHSRSFNKNQIVENGAHLESFLKHQGKGTKPAYRRGYLMRLLPDLEPLFQRLALQNDSFKPVVTRIQLLLDRYGVTHVENAIKELNKSESLRIDSLELSLSQFNGKNREHIDGSGVKYSLPKHLRNIETVHRNLETYKSTLEEDKK